MKIRIDICIPDEKIVHHTKAEQVGEKLMAAVEHKLEFCDLDRFSNVELHWEFGKHSRNINNESNPS